VAITISRRVSLPVLHGTSICNLLRCASINLFSLRQEPG